MRWVPTTSSFVVTRLGARPLATLLAGLALALPTNAHALGEYRDKVAQFVQASPDSIPCDTCHNDPGGGGPRQRPFYLTLEANGLVAAKATETLPPALEAAAAKKADSDGDSVEDMVELKAGFSPNDANSKPPPDNTGGSGPAGAGGSGTPPPPPPPPPPDNTGGSGAGGRSGAGGAGGKPEPRPADNTDNKDDEVELAPGATAQSCSASSARGGSAKGAALLVALTFFAQMRSKKRGRGRNS